MTLQNGKYFVIVENMAADYNAKHYLNFICAGDVLIAKSRNVTGGESPWSSVYQGQQDPCLRRQRRRWRLYR